MNPASLSTLTWATVSAAVASAALLAVAGDGLAGWRPGELSALEPGLATRKPARAERPLRSPARPGSAPVVRRER